MAMNSVMSRLSCDASMLPAHPSSRSNPTQAGTGFRRRQTGRKRSHPAEIPKGSLWGDFTRNSQLFMYKISAYSLGPLTEYLYQMTAPRAMDETVMWRHALQFPFA